MVIEASRIERYIAIAVVARDIRHKKHNGALYLRNVDAPAGNEIGAHDLALIKGKRGKKLYIFIGKNLFYHDLPPNF